MQRPSHETSGSGGLGLLVVAGLVVVAIALTPRTTFAGSQGKTQPPIGYAVHPKPEQPPPRESKRTTARKRPHDPIDKLLKRRL